MILALCMVLSTMSFVVSAEETTTLPDRYFSIEASASEVEAGDDVVITVRVNGDNLANSKWNFTYDADMFELNSITDYDGITTAATASGTIEGHHFFTNGLSVYTSGDAVASYTFEALPQDPPVSDETGTFTVLDAYAYTYYESIKGIDVDASTDSVDVTIKLIEYTEKITINGRDYTGSTYEELRFNNEDYTFVVETEPTATVTYKVDGVEVPAVNIKDRKPGGGSYTIEYTVVPAPGYKGYTKTFELNIIEPEFLVEFVDDYVPGKSLVLVYTNTDNVYFTYAGNTMLDVTARRYKYNDATGYHNHVYGFVVDGIPMGTVDAYKANIKDIYDDSELVTIDSYTTNVNFEGGVDIRDITSIYGIYNVNPTYFATYEFIKNILAADIVGNDKCVDGNDADAVVEDVYPTTNN